MIQAYYAEIRTDNNLEKEFSRTAKYWRERGRIRLREQNTPWKTVDLEITGGRLQVIPTFDGKTVLDSHISGTIITNKHYRVADADPWEFSLFSLPVGIHTRPPELIYSLSEAAQRGRVTSVEWSRVGGHRLGHLNIELNPGVREYEVWVDPARNCLIAKCIHTYQGSGSKLIWRLEYQVEGWAEPSSTIFVPTKVLHKTFLNGKLVNDIVAIISNVRVNSPLPARPAMPSLPAGTLVFDELQGGTYKIDGAGNKVGGFAPSGGDYSPMVPAKDSQATSGSFMFVGLVFAGTSVVLFGAGLWWRKRHAARDQR
jgi:hypothetical protein